MSHSQNVTHLWLAARVWLRTSFACINGGREEAAQRALFIMNIFKHSPTSLRNYWKAACGGVKGIERMVFACCGSRETAALPGLRASLDKFSSICYERDYFGQLAGLKDEHKRDLFCERIFPRVVEWAFEHAELSEMQVLTHRNPASQCLEVSNKVLRAFLANMFICNVDVVRDNEEDAWRKANEVGANVNLGIDDLVDSEEQRDVNFASLYMMKSSVGVARVVAMMLYFLQEVIEEERDASNERVVSFERHRIPQEEAPVWESDSTLVNTDQVFVHTKAMENVIAPCFVDFANRCIHIHTVIPSATQEEVLFSCVPECFLAIPLYDTLWDRDVAIIRNVRRYSTYSGYMGTFNVTAGFHSPPPEELVRSRSLAVPRCCSSSASDEVVAPNTQDVIVIDAVMGGHAQEQSHIRDLTKCYIAFKSFRGERESAASAISSGKWGCGIFGGEVHVKFLEQVMAATLAGTPLFFSTFRSDEERERMHSLLSMIKENALTVGELFGIITRYRNGSFLNYFEMAVIACVGARA